MTLSLPDPLVNQGSWEQERTGVQRNLDRVAQQFPIGPNQLMSGGVVTSLPSTPIDGQEVYYVADATNGVVWHLKYRAASGSAYKWEYVGGAPLYATVTTNESTATSANFVDLATAGPAITLPLAGDFIVRHGAFIYDDTVSQDGLMSLSINGGAAASATDARAVRKGQASAGINGGIHVFREQRLTGLTAAAVTARYRVTGGTANFWDRSLSLTPVRVG